MFFKNIIAYKFKQTPNYEKESFEKALQQDKCAPLSNTDLIKTGWSNALGKYNNTLSFFDGDIIILRKQITERVLNATAINQLVDEKVERVEKAESRPVKKKERDEIKENIIHMHLPNALPKTTYQEGYIDIKNELIIVNASSFNKAEEFLALLRKSLGSLPVIPIFINFDLENILTKYLVKEFSINELTVGANVKCFDPCDKTVKETFENGDLSSERIQNAINEEGMKVEYIDFDYREDISFTMHADGLIKKLKFSDVIKEQNADIPKEDMQALLRADYLLSSGVIGDLLVALEKAFIDKFGEPNAQI